MYSSAWILFETAFRSDLQAERLFCRFGICDTDAVLAAETLEHGGNIAAVPNSELLEAVRRDAAAPQRWCDLGESMLKIGETGQARYCFSRALALGPDIPYMLVRAADFHFSLHENREGLELTARALALDSGYWDVVFGDYEQKGIRVDDVLRFGLPQGANVSKAFLRRLLYQQRASDAAGGWNAIVSRGYADDTLANEYVEFLIQSGKYEAAQNSWVQYAGRHDKGYPNANRVFNGDFESDPMGSRFDWMIDPASGAAIGFDRGVHYSGTRSLRLQFDGTQNVSNIGVRQTVFLKPGRYRLEAYFRTTEITTDEGVALSVVDSEAPKRLSFTTEGMLGSNNWQLVEHTFQVLPGTGLLQVSLVRKPSLRFDNLIRGTVWIDHVSISPDREMASAARQ
jgi:tetratricopeptide (TPR) repeat protein